MSAPKSSRPPHLCLKCGRNLRDRKRRCARTALCLRCFNNPKVRAEFRLAALPPKKPASSPTTAPPGSEAKVRLLIRRLKWGQALHHPGDAVLPLPDIDDQDAWNKLQADMLMNLVHGVYVEQKETARARAYPYCPRRKRRVHLGYFATRAEAAAEVVLWINAGRPDGWTERRRESSARLPRRESMVMA